MDNDYRAQLEAAKQASVGQLLIKAARLFNEEGIRRVRERFPAYARFGLSHLAIMPHLDLAGTRTTELAKRMDVTKQAVAQLVDDLVDAGWVERVPDPADKRAKLVRFTSAGRGSLLDGLSVLGDIEAEVRRAIGDEPTERLRLTLLDIIRLLDRPASR